MSHLGTVVSSRSVDDIFHCRQQLSGSKQAVYAMQIYVLSKGYAAQRNGEEYIVDMPLETMISSDPEGASGGGWSVDFHSPSEQLGNDPSKLYVKFTTVANYSNAPVEVYMLPRSQDDSMSMSVLVCTRVELGNDAPIPTLFGLQPQYVDHGPHDDSDYATSSDQHDDDEGGNVRDSELYQPRMSSAQAKAEQFGIVDLPDECLYFESEFLAWSLDPGQLTVPAPPRDIFDTLGGYGNSTAGTSSAMRRLLDVQPGSDIVNDGTKTPFVAELFVNSMCVASANVVYHDDEGPRISSVAPAVISAAVPEVCHQLIVQACFCCTHMVLLSFGLSCRL